MGKDAAYRASLSLIEQFGVNWLISVGVCGGLRDSLHVGDIVQVASIVEENERRWIALDLPQTEPQDTPIHRDGVLFCSSTILASPGAKRDAFARWQADAVDMESAGVARAAAEKGARFSCVRSLSDAVDDRLPMDFSPFVGDDGQLRISAMLLSLAVRPWLIPGLIRLGIRTGQASRRLASYMVDSLGTCSSVTAGAQP